MIKLFLSSVLVLVAFQSQASDCSQKSKTNDECWVTISDLHPTQAGFSQQHVLKKAKKLSGYEKKKLNSYIRAHKAPIVIGPQGELFIVDRHHLALALNAISESKIYAVVLANNSKSDSQNFWKKMIANKWVYLGSSTDPDDLPTSLSDLQDDPYRTLTETVSDRGGFKKTEVYFADCMWADYFRSRIDISAIGLDAAVEKALEIAHDSEAQHLPGYIH